MKHFDTLFVIACITGLTAYQMHLGKVLEGGAIQLVIGGLLGYITKAGVDMIKTKKADG